ncbi:MAG: ABC transporter ATP-binding protein [Rhizobacter sp.]
MSAALQAQRVSVSLGGRPVLREVSLTLQTGWTVVVGANGAGKSTLLRSLAGLQVLEGGQVMLHDRALNTWSPRERSRQIAWLAQQGGATGELTVREVVHLGRLPHLGLFAEPGPEDEAAVQRAMALTECTAWEHRRLHQLSGGERQRALLACALAVDAPILLLDEPTTHLDPPHQVALVRLFKHIASQRIVVTVLHDLPLALRADHLVVMQAGRVVAEGRSDDPAVHAALVAVFDHAVRIERFGDRFVALPNLD